jgi:hypothetical protein
MSIRRAVTVIGLALAISGVTAVVGPTAAFAGTAIKVVQIPCPSWVPSAVGLWGQPEYVVSSNETFRTTESRIVVNDLDVPATASFTSQESHTFTIAATSGFTFNNLFSFLNINVSSTITSSTTTQIGVTAGTTVAPHSSVIGDYGVNVYDVTFMGYLINRRSIGGCWVHESDMGHEEVYTPAPTYIQGWRLRAG